jgi:glycolate oxidase iron-sulfur subunit
VGGQRRPGLIERVVRWFVFGHLFMSMSTFRLFVTALWLYQASGLQWLVRATGLLRLLGQADNDRLLPTLQKDFLVPGGETYASAAQGVGQPVVFFAGCVMSTALANTDRATIRVLQRWGFDVVNPAGQGCCGALHAHGGDLDRARELARRNIAAFEAQGDAPIVNNAAGCGAMLKDYAHHLRDDPAWADRARAFSARVKDLTEVLAGGRTPHMAPQQLVVTYQEPCHLVHAQRISQQPRALLKSIPGLQLREMAESSLCCGSAGVYNVTNPIQSLQLRERKLDNAHATGAEVIVTANPGCLMQLEAGLAARGGGRRAVHIADLLDQATSTS